MNLFQTVCWLITITGFSYVILILAIHSSEVRQLKQAATWADKKKILDRWERRSRRRFNFLP
jgi:hypothetical protein